MATKPTWRDVHVDAALSNISIAYKNTDYIAEGVFPRVPVSHVSDKFYVFPASNWFRDEARVRGPGAEPATVDYSLTTGSYVCIEYAMAHLLDDNVRDNADDALRPEQEAVELVTDKLLLAQEIRVADLATTAANWKNNAAAGTAWSSDTSDPFGDISGCAIRAVTSEIGRMPNTIAMSASVWLNLINHPDMLDRYKHTTPGGILTPESFAGLFPGINKIYIGNSVKNTATEGATDSISFIWGSNVWVGWVPPSPGLFAPASGYVFEFRSRSVDRFRKDSQYSDLFVARHMVDEVITGSEAGFVISSAV